MPTSLLKQCPQCSTSFQARRKNQDYCSTECRIDHNNQVAKERYAISKVEVPKVDVLQQKVKRLEDFLNSLTIVIQGVEYIDSDTIRYMGRKYRRIGTNEGPGMGISLGAGGAVLIPGNKIIYRGQYSSSYRHCGIYGIDN